MRKSECCWSKSLKTIKLFTAVLAVGGSVMCSASEAGEKIYLWKDATIKSKDDRPSITPMLLNDGKIHPAMLVIPGGGYHMVCRDIEGDPIARKFNELGYHAFILDYRVRPPYFDRAIFPRPQLDAMRAVKLIRSNAEKWKIAPDQVYVCGFSAGGHLAGSLGILCDDLDASDGDEADKFSHVPDASVLCYGVLVFAPWGTQDTPANLLGRNGYEKVMAKYSLAENVTEKTPPAFLVHTIRDQVVPYQTSVKFAEAMAAKGVPCELALYYWGEHGMMTGRDTLDVSNWPRQAHEFLQSLQLEKHDPEFAKRYTHQYQNERKHK